MVAPVNNPPEEERLVQLIYIDSTPTEPQMDRYMVPVRSLRGFANSIFGQADMQIYISLQYPMGHHLIGEFEEDEDSINEHASYLAGRPMYGNVLLVEPSTSGVISREFNSSEN